MQSVELSFTLCEQNCMVPKEKASSSDLQSIPRRIRNSRARIVSVPPRQRSRLLYISNLAHAENLAMLVGLCLPYGPPSALHMPSNSYKSPSQATRAPTLVKVVYRVIALSRMEEIPLRKKMAGSQRH